MTFWGSSSFCFSFIAKRQWQVGVQFFFHLLRKDDNELGLIIIFNFFSFATKRRWQTLARCCLLATNEKKTRKQWWAEGLLSFSYVFSIRCKQQWQTRGLVDIFLCFCACYDPNLGFVTKARACKGAGQEWSLGVTFHAPESVGGCEGMNPHIPKWAPTLGVEAPMDSQIFIEQLQGSKPIGLKSSLYYCKALET
jgi:hypothetical protein